MNRYLHHYLGALILLITLAGGGTAQARSDENTIEGSKKGEITGRVVNESGQPLANATVSVRAFGGGGPGHPVATDSEGSFKVTGLDPVLYVISAYSPAYVAAPRDPDSTPAAYFRVGDTANLQLIKGGVVTGTVTNSADTPVVVVPVRAYMVRDGNGQPSRYGAPFREGVTDDRGVYRIYGLQTGTYVISAGGGENQNGYRLDPYSNDAPSYFPSSTRDAATEVSIRSGEETANIDIRYRGEAGHKISGVANHTIALDQPTEFSITLTSVFSGASQFGYTVYQPSVDRGFTFSGIPDGDYYVTAQIFLPEGGWAISEPRRIKVKGADITGIELVVKPLGSITGRVMLEESPAPECKGKRRPVFSEIVVTPWHNEKIASKDQPQFLWGLSGPRLTDRQGEFAMRNLAPGQYRFNIRQMEKYWYVKSMSWPPATTTAAKATPNRSIDAARNWTTLKSGDRLAGLTITLAAGAASLRGQIDLGVGQKLPSRLFVYLVPAERENADDVLRFFASPASGDGSFALGNLPPGRYWILAHPAGENESNALSKLLLPDESEARAKLRQDAEAGKIETELKPCQNLTGYRLPFGSNGPGH